MEVNRAIDAFGDAVGDAAGHMRSSLERLVGRKQPIFSSGNALTLLQGSREFFPALVQAMNAAQHSIYFETYIFNTTATGTEVAEALLRAAERGVAVHVVVDGFGTSVFDSVWQQRFDAAGVKMRVFSPPGRWFLFVRQQWQRMHRKLCAIDNSVAFCGGINVLDDFYDPQYGTLSSPRLDFTVQVTGPVAASISQACQLLWLRLQGQSLKSADIKGLAEPAQMLRNVGEAPSSAMLVLRDNLRKRRQIERAYLYAIGRSRQSMIIANAYFFPSRKLLNALVTAAKRGVRVQLLLQGRYEYFMQFHASRAFYQTLLKAGVEIYEYERSFLHAKVAVIDADTQRAWATVGSSNLDPLSLLLAREANVVARDSNFALQLQAKLQNALGQGSRISAASLAERSLKMRAFDRVAFVMARAMIWLVKDRF